MKRLTILAISLVLAIAGLGAAPLQAHADDNLPPRVLTAPLDGPDYPYINIHSGPGTEYPVIAQVPAGTDFWIGCWGSGTPVTGPYGTTEVWYEAPDFGGWASDADIWTGSNEPVTQGCETPPVGMTAPIDENLIERIAGDPWSVIRETAYDRVAAAEWAYAHVDDEVRYSQDCTWFVSQALWAGGMSKTDEWTDSSWNFNDQASRRDFPGPSKAAAHADYFKEYMVANWATYIDIDWSDNTAGGAEVGDVIAYDWDGDGKINHVALVTSVNEQGYPSITQHTPAQKDRYWSWSDSGNDWIEFASPGATAHLIKFNI